MRPKPTREWVMVELERLGVRVVSGRLGRKAGDDDDGGEQRKGTWVSCLSVCLSVCVRVFPCTSCDAEPSQHIKRLT